MSGGQCNLNHLTILSRFSWPSFAYMCTKVAYSPIHFIFCYKFKFLFFKPQMEEYKKITVNVIHRTYNITLTNVYITTQSITVFFPFTFSKIN